MRSPAETPRIDSFVWGAHGATRAVPQGLVVVREQWRGGEAQVLLRPQRELLESHHDRRHAVGGY